MKCKKEFFALRVLENKKYPVGKLVVCDFLAHPSLNSKEFARTNPKDYVWQVREFAYPLFKKKQKGEIFCIALIVSEEYTHLQDLPDEGYVAKAKTAFNKHNKHMKKKWREIGKSKFWNRDIKPAKNIEL